MLRVGLLAVLIATTAAAAPVTPATYLLSFHFEDGDQLIGTGRLQVRAGETATIMKGDEARSAITIRMTATPQADGQLSVSSEIDAVSQAGVHRRAQPALRVLPNRPSVIEFGELSPTANPVRVAFTYGSVATPAR